MKMNRVNKAGYQYFLSEIFSPEKEVEIRRGEKYIVVKADIRDLSQSWYNWQMQGYTIQDAFPYLSASEREFIITGITPDEWEIMFAEPEMVFPDDTEKEEK